MAVLTLAACGGGSSNSKAPDNGGDGTASITVSLSSSTVTAASPATVTAKLKTATGKAASGVVVNFSTTNGNGSLSAESALSDEDGVATVTLSPASSTTAGADTVVATAQIGTSTVTASKGFSLVATNSNITGFTADSGTSSSAPVSAYGQTVLSVALGGVSTTAPATVSLNSTCVAAGKATISPASVTTTTSPVLFTYKDNGCGATLSTDTVTASISGTTISSTLAMFISSPEANNIVFVSATPETIYLQGSGLTTSSNVVFQVNDRNNSPLPNQVVTLSLTTFTGGLTIQGGQTPVTRTSDSSGRVSVLVNSGTVPTPVRVTAALASGVSTVSSNLAVAVGLPSQLNFSLSQATMNIEGYNIDGTTNSYTIYAADRSGNPVPAGTTISFWAEGGQIASSSQTRLNNAIASTTVSFVSQAPRPADGRVTVVAYALGEESFIDLNGNNVWDIGEPFQDLGDVTKDKLFDSSFDPAFDEFVSLSGTDSSACTDYSASYPILKLIPAGADAWIPSRPGTCDGVWTQRTYVRRSVETVLSTSEAGAVWLNTRPLTNGACSVAAHQVTKNVGPTLTASAVPVTKVLVASGDVAYTGSGAGSLYFAATDNNAFRFNPMAAGTVVSATAQTTGLTTKVAGGSPVISTTAPFPGVGVAYEFSDDATIPGVFTLSFRSPSGFGTSYTITIDPRSTPATPCTIQ
ncbi:MAG: hypothetical protein QM702_07065 [Rubrivivax sp.]